MKTAYCLTIRLNDDVPWGETEYYRTRKERDHDERYNRCLGGLRTHSFQEKKTPKEFKALFN